MTQRAQRDAKEREGYLPVQGFVLAGGKSSRMGRDKALLPFRGRPMVEIAVEKLRGFCSAVSIAGNREDLSRLAPVVPEQRMECGPAAGIEAGLMACTQPWAMFVPVDVPLVPGELLRRWAEAVVARPEVGASYLVAGGVEQPAFCMFRAESLGAIREAVEEGERRVRNLLWIVEQGERVLWVCDVAAMAEDLLSEQSLNLQVGNWFLNVNTPDDLSDAEVSVTTSLEPSRRRG